MGYLALCVIFAVLGIVLGMWLEESERFEIEKEYGVLLNDLIKAEKKIASLESQIMYLHNLDFTIEKDGQMRVDFPDDTEQWISVPYNVMQEGVLVKYLQVWSIGDYLYQRNPDYIWIERLSKGKRNKNYYRNMWIHVDDFDSYTDKIRDHVELDFDFIDSNLPCKWEYLGWEEPEYEKV